MYCYQAFGLGIHSEFALFDLSVQEVTQDVAIVEDKIDITIEEETSYPYIKLSPQEVIFLIKDVGRFRISHGCQIVVDPDLNADRGEVQRYLVGPAMVFLLYQRNHLVLHASAVNMYGQGIAFLGDSGAGKSSIAAAFLAQGHKLVVDDIAAVKMNSSHAWLNPGFPYIKLSHEAKETIALQPEQLEFMDLVDDKVSWHLSHLAHNERVPLRHIYVIQPGEKIGIERFNSQQALFELMRFSIPVRMVRLNHVAHFEHCVELLKHVQVFGLMRPQSLTQLFRLVNLVEENMSQMEQSSKQGR